MTFDEISKQSSQPSVAPTQGKTGLSFADIAPQPVQKPLPQPTPRKTGGIFSQLASYAPAFMTAGPMGVAAQYMSQHPKETAEAAGSTVKAFAQAPIQLTKGLAAEYAGLTGDEATRTELLKPQTYPILGEVKQISAAPEDIAKSQTQTPGQTALQAIELGAMGEGVGPRTVLGRTPGRVLAESKPGQYVTEKAGQVLSKVGDVAEKYVGGVAKKLGVGTEEEALAETIKQTMPAINKKEMESAILTPTKTPEGKYVPRVTGANREVQATTFDKKVGESVHGLFEPNASPAQKVADIKNGIQDVATTHVEPILQQNMKPFNQATFNKVIDDVPVRQMFKSDPSNTYKNVQEMAKEISAKYPKTKLGSWNARKEFDAEVEKQFPRVFDGSTADSAIKFATNDVRTAWNNFITSGYPEGSRVKQAFDQMFHMYTAADNIAEKGAIEAQKWLPRMAQKYPTAAKAAKIAAGTAVVGTLGLEGKKALGL